MVNLLDESGCQKLVDLLTNDPTFLLVESAQPLLHWLGTSSNFQGVHGDLPRYARHVRGTPCKHVGVCTEKVDERSFLFGVEVSADRQHLVIGAVGVEQDLLRALCWLEVSRMVLRLRSLSDESLEPRGKPRPVMAW